MYGMSLINKLGVNGEYETTILDANWEHLEI